MKSILLFFLLIAYSIEMTRVYKNSKTYLPTNSNSNYFYIVNDEYSYYSTYIYFCLEDNDFSLNYNSIKVCKTNNDPRTNEQSAINSCSSNYDYLTYYGSTTTSSKKNIITGFTRVAFTIIPLFIILVVIVMEIFMLLLMIVIFSLMMPQKHYPQWQ